MAANQTPIGLSSIDQAGNRRTTPRRSDDAGLTPLAFFELLYRRWPTIALTAAVAVVVALALLVVIPPTYKATSVVLVDPRERNITKSQEVLSNIGQDAAAVESQVELITSNEIISAMIKKFRLDQDLEFTKKSLVSKIVTSITGKVDKTPASKLESRLVAAFKQRMDVQRRGLTYVIEINFASRNPEKAARIANGIAEAYLKDQHGTRLNATVGASNWLSDRIKTLRTAVEDSQRAVAKFKAEHKIVDIGASGSGDTLYRRQIANINEQLIAARANVVETKARLEQIGQVIKAAGDPGSISTALNSTVITRLRVAYADLTRTRSEYALTYGPRHPRLVTVNQQLAEMRKQIDQEIRRIFASARNEHEVALTRQKSLSASLKDMEGEAARLSQLKVRLDELTREADANRRLYEQFIERHKETNAQQSLLKPEARIVSAALVPIKPARPGTKVILLIAAVAGIAIGIGLAFTLELKHHSRREEAVQRKVNAAGRLPTLIAAPEPSARIRPVASLAAPEPEIATLATIPDVSTGDPSAGAEVSAGFSKLLASLGHGSTEAGGHALEREAILVTAPEHGTGTTTIAANMAARLARQGRVTLLVSLNAGDSILAKMFKTEKTGGLTEVVAGQLPLEDAIARDETSGLFILGSGERTAIPGDIARHPQLAELLKNCADVFEVVVIDGPVLDQPGAMPKQVSDAADAIVLVLDTATRRSGEHRTAARLLGAARRKLIGAVFNKASIGAHDKAA